MSRFKNLVLHSKTKHISIDYHVLGEKIAEKEIRLEYVSTKDWIIDIFTKPLPKDKFEYMRGMLGVMPLPTLEYRMQRVHWSSGTDHYCYPRLNDDGSHMGEYLWWSESLRTLGIWYWTMCLDTWANLGVEELVITIGM